MYGANFIAKFWGESGFLRGDSMDTPLQTPMGVKVPWSL